MEPLFPLEGKYPLWLFLLAGLAGCVLAVVLVSAEERHFWFAAQASLVTILLLSALVAWGVWGRNRKTPPQLSVEGTTYYRATRKVLLCVTIGLAALVLNAIRYDHWYFGVVAKAIGFGILQAGAFFIFGALFGYLFGLNPVAPSWSSGDQSSSTQHPNLAPILNRLRTGSQS